MSKAQIQLPPKLIPVFSGDYRYRGAYGGRGSGKTVGFALMSAVKGYQFGEAGVNGVILCGREFMNSLEESSMAEVKAAIRSVPWLEDYYEIGEKFIRSKNGLIKYVFAGLRHNLASIKSKSRILICWVDEAEPVSFKAWKDLIPTVRTEGSEIWVTWNPEDRESETHKRFRENPPSNSCIVEINWQDNPWFDRTTLPQERLDDLKNRPDTYDHIWEGGFLEISDSQIFAGKYTVMDFEAEGLGDPLHGLDFGFATDPTAIVRCYLANNRLYVSHEAGRSKLELDETADYAKERVPDCEKYTIRADCARPESISYLQRHGLPRIIGPAKLKIEDGIEFIKSLEEVVIHTRCEQVAREFRRYSYKVDPRTEDVLPIIVDKDNHYIDAIRYALYEVIKQSKAESFNILGMF